MTTQISFIDHYYHSPNGRLVAHMLRGHLQEVMRFPHQSDMPGEMPGEMLGFGYPYMCLPHHVSLPVLIPQEMGALASADDTGVMSVCAASDAWPFESESMDQILMTHGLEFTHDPLGCLTEACRVLKGAGQLVLMVPHRRSLWVRAEKTPFGQGRPFSKSQLTKLLHEAGFEITSLSRHLHSPPIGLAFGYGLAQLVNKIGQHGWGVFGGVMIVEATKLVYAKRPTQNQPIKALSGLFGKPAVKPRPTPKASLPK